MDMSHRYHTTRLFPSLAVMACLILPSVSSAGFRSRSVIDMRTPNAPKRMTIDEDMGERHRREKRPASLKRPEKSMAQINEECVKTYESFQFEAKYNALAAILNERKNEIDVAEAKRLMGEFEALNSTCYRLTYKQDVSPHAKELSFMHLKAKYQELATYTKKIGEDYAKFLEEQVSSLQADLRESNTLADNLAKELDALGKERKADAEKLSRVVEEKSDTISSQANTIASLQRKVRTESTALLILSAALILLLTLFLSRIA